MGKAKYLSAVEQGMVVGARRTGLSVSRTATLLCFSCSTFYQELPHKLTEQDRQLLKCVLHKNHLSSVTTLTTEYQTASGSNVSTKTVRRELHEMGFHGRAATHKTKITMHCPNSLLEW
uniref:Transposase Tc1-like domain-containing protein n=1 Tax=Oncorhynchus mykiss TaxID=8022 RepID=A0A8K9UBV3_ONCMY